MSTAAAIVPRTKIVGANHGESQISANPWNEPRIVTGGALGGLFVRDPLLADGWGLIDAGLANTVLVGGGATAMPAWSTDITLTSLTVGTVTADTITGTTINGGTINGTTINGGTITGSIIATGPLKLANNAYLTGRNAGNTADVKLIGLDVNNTVSIAPSGVQETLIGFNLVVLGNVKVPPNALMYWVSAVQLQGVAAGQLNLLSDVGTSGVGFDVATDGVLKVRTRAQTSDAALTASYLRAGPADATTPLYGDLITNRGGNPGTGAVIFGGSATAHYLYFTGTGFSLTDGLAVAGPIDAGSLTLAGTVTITASGGVIQVGGAIKCSPYLAVGVNPAQAGTIRIPNNNGVYARNAANTGDLPFLYYDTSDQLVLGYASRPVIPYSINQDLGLAPSAVTWRSGYFSTSLSIGNLPATGGALRLSNTQYVTSRNGANTSDIFLLGLHSDNAIYMGSAGCLAVAPYDPACALGMGSAPWASFSVAGAITINNTISMTAAAAALTVSGDVYSNGAAGFRAPSGGGFYWAGKTFLAAPAASQLVLENTAATIGVGLDFATNAVLKIRTLTQAAYADIICSTLTLDAAYFRYKDRGFMQAAGDGVFSLANNAGTGLDSFSPNIDSTGTLGTSGKRWQSAYLNSSVALGTNPAVGGYIRLPQTGYVYARNAANTGDIFVIGCGVGGDDAVYVGHPSSGLNLRGTSITVPSITATNFVNVGGTAAPNVGEIRLPKNGNGITFTDAAGTGYQFALYTDSANDILLGDHGTGGGTACQNLVLRAVSRVWCDKAGLALGALPALTGTLRLTNNTAINVRNAANNADLSLVAVDAANAVYVGADMTRVNLGAAASLTACAGDFRVPDNFWVYWTTRGALAAIGIDRIALLNVNNTSGVGLDFSFDGVLQIRNRTHTADAFLRAQGVTAVGLTATGTVLVGPTPAGSGSIRISNNDGIASRNAANTADLYLMYLNGSNQIILGNPTTTIVLKGQLLIDSAALLNMNDAILTGSERAIAPGAPGVAGFQIYARNTGGKTELIAVFNTGGAVRLAIQP